MLGDRLVGEYDGNDYNGIVTEVTQASIRQGINLNPRNEGFKGFGRQIDEFSYTETGLPNNKHRIVINYHDGGKFEGDKTDFLFWGTYLEPEVTKYPIM